MNIPAGILLPWPGADATVHAGWTRKTSLDGKFFRVITSGTGGTAGGAANHTHTEDSHFHTFSAGAATQTANRDNSIFTRNAPANVAHGHAVKDGSPTTATVQAANNDPSHLTVIWKESDGSAAIPNLFLCLSDTGTYPAAFATHANSDGRYWKGAAAGADGGTQAGSDTHVHSQDAHTHAAVNSNIANSCYSFVGAAAPVFASCLHTHAVDLTSGGSGDTGSASSDPIFTKYLVLQNTSGAAADPFIGLIGLWLGAASAVPNGWQIVSPTNPFIKCETTSSQIGDTGGAAQHTHTGYNHTHGYNAGASSASVGYLAFVPTGTLSHPSHTHTWTIGSTTPTVNNNTAESHYPSYLEAFIVKYVGTGHLLASLGVGK